MARWGKYADLSAAAKRTFATPDSSEIVELATHDQLGPSSLC